MEPGSEEALSEKPDRDDARALLALVHGLVAELHPERARGLQVQLNSDFERDLGLDSLARGELIARIEKDFGVHVPEQRLAGVETPRHLLDAMADLASVGAPEGRLERREIAVGPAREAPAEAESLTEVLDWHCFAHADRPHILLLEDGGEDRVLSFRELQRAARQAACGLVARGIVPGDRVAIMLPSSADFFFAFYGVLYAGGVPVPIYPPMRLSGLEDHLKRQARILSNAGARILIAFDEAKPLGVLLKPFVESLTAIETVAHLRAAKPCDLPTGSKKGELALIQYTSGSTGDPKGVALSHANLLVNIRSMGHVLKAGPKDVFVSWLPLYHDMGLIGAWLGSLYFAAPLALMSPLTFLSKPERWLWAIHRHRGTLSAAPNFAFELCLRRIKDEDIEGLDLSSLRLLTNGAEPVSPRTLKRFAERFSKHGLRPEALAPVFGLAECAVGLCFPPLGRSPLIKTVERETLLRRGLATPAEPGAADALDIVACGAPLPGHEIRIVDAAGHEVGEGQEGVLQFRGPSATDGYFRNPEKTRALKDGAWLNTGDLAFILGGELYFTGREKDIIIRAGRNIHPYEVEEAVADISGVRRGCVAVFGVSDAAEGTEKVVIVAETRESDPAIRRELEDRIRETAADIIGAPPDAILLAPPQSVPKTSSGKLRRAAARALYEAGGVTARRVPVWWQVAKLMAEGGVKRSFGGLRALRHMLYAGWFWLSLTLLGVVLWPLVLCLPSLRARWAVLHRFARGFLALAGLRLNLENAPEDIETERVFAVNHASYLDGLVLVAAFPKPVAFVAKKELEEQAVAGLFLKRLGAVFVERTDSAAVSEVKEACGAVLRQGRPLVFFPEATLTRMPGLLPFRLGAFVVAAESGVRVAPVALSGTRSALRGGQWWPRRNPLSVVFGADIRPQGAGFDAAVRLRDAARAQLLEMLGEPDLVEERVIFTERGIERVAPGAGVEE